MTALLSLAVFGMDRVEWIPLTTVRTPVPAVSVTMPSYSTAMASSPMDLIAVVIVSTAVSPYLVYASIFQLASLSLIIAFFHWLDYPIYNE